MFNTENCFCLFHRLCSLFSDGSSQQNSTRYEFGRATFCIHTLDYTQYQLSTTTTSKIFAIALMCFSVHFVVSIDINLFSVSPFGAATFFLRFYMRALSLQFSHIYTFAKLFSHNLSHTQKQNMCNEHF